MAHVNENYLKLPGNYLFATIAKKVDAYSKAHPEANIIRLGIGDVTRPLASAIIDAMQARGALAQVDVVLSGYQGGTDIAGAILDAVARVKALNPRASYTCDPVMGNARSGCFVNPAIPALLRERVVPAADLVTPNQFELGTLAGCEATTLASTLQAVDAVMAMGPQTVLVTSVERPERAPGTLEMLAADASGAWLVATPHLPFKANGSGDVTAALFTAHYSQHFGATGAAKTALERTTASMFELLQRTHAHDPADFYCKSSRHAHKQLRVQELGPFTKK